MCALCASTVRVNFAGGGGGLSRHISSRFPRSAVAPPLICRVRDIFSPGRRVRLRGETGHWVVGRMRSNVPEAGCMPGPPRPSPAPSPPRRHLAARPDTSSTMCNAQWRAWSRRQSARESAKHTPSPWNVFAFDWRVSGVGLIHAGTFRASLRIRAVNQANRLRRPRWPAPS